MDLSVIEELKLKDAFSDLKLFADIKCSEDYFDFLIERRTKNRIFICDSEKAGHSIFVDDTNGIGVDKMFRIDNSSKSDVFLLHIDGVLFSKDSKCDCAVITGDELDFIEFKSNAINKSDEAIKSNYEKASLQLLSTVDEFRRRYNLLEERLEDKRRLECYAVFNKTVPNNPAYQKKLSVKFLQDSNGVKLKFMNSKSI